MEKSFSHLYTNLILQYEVLEDGKEVTKSVTLSRVNNNLTAEELVDIASKFGK